MNREEFMAKLKVLLGDIPADEREEACSTMKTILMMQEQTTRQK